MFKVFATEAVISKGYDGAPALRFSENGESVRFRIGMKVYDSKAENNARWINISVKAFKGLCERIKKMQLKDGSRINLIGRLDEDTWEDKTTHEQKSVMVIILDEVEYCFTGTGEKKSEDGPKATAVPQEQASPANAGNPPDGFTGFEPFGGGDSFFDA